MGSQYRIRSFANVIVYVFCTAMLLSACVSPNQNNVYQRALEKLRTNDTVYVQDIFDFEFTQAYVFNDCYISGDGFAERYNFDLSISAVKPGISENIYRIVFVNTHGELVYEFQYDVNVIDVSNKGVIIYPETKIICQHSPSDLTNTITFENAYSFE